MSNLTIRRFQLKDKPQLKAFYNKAFGIRARYKYPERWKWQFWNNPWKDPEKIHVYIAEQNGKIVGHTAACRVKCKIFKNCGKLGWGVDAFVLPTFRGQGLGKKLQKINQDDHLLFASIHMSSYIMNIKIKLGARRGPTTSLYVFLIRYSSEILLRKAPKILIDSILNPVMFILHNMVIVSQKLKRTRINKAPYRFTDIKTASFNSNDSKLWRSIRNYYDFAVERDKQYLNWRYKEQPWTQHYCLRAYDNKQELVGLIIFRVTDETVPKAGIILEVLCNPTNKRLFYSLVLNAEKYLVDMDATQIHIAHSDINFISSIKAMGYTKVGEKPLIIHGQENVLSDFGPSSKILLTKGDQDWDQFLRCPIYSPIHIIKKLIMPTKSYSKKNDSAFNPNINI